MARIAVIDIGTQSVLYLLADFSPPAHESIDRDAAGIRLGLGLAETGKIAADRTKALVDRLRALRTRAESRRADRIVAFGTHVFRAAQNRDAVIRTVAEKTGIRIQVLSEREEAEWSFRGILYGRDASGRIITADIGGGSTEWIAGTDGTMEAHASIPAGAVTLTERFLRRDPPDPAEWAAMKRKIAGLLVPATARLGMDGARLFASGGTATTLAAMELGMRDYDPVRVDGFVLSGERLAAWITRCLSMPAASRRGIPGLEPGRADIIPAGAAVLQSLLERTDLKEVTISDRGLRHGIALREMRRMGSA